MVTHYNNYKEQPSSYNKDFSYYKYQESPVNYNNWYDSSPSRNNIHAQYYDRTSTPDYRSDAGSSDGNSACLSRYVANVHEREKRTSNSYYNNGTYGSRTDDDDEDGFLPKTNKHNYHQTVVNFTENNVVGTSVIRDTNVEASKASYSCCDSISCCDKSSTSHTRTPQTTQYFSSWCKRTFLLLLLLLLVVIFVLISGILLYHNYIQQSPTLSHLEEPCGRTYCKFGAYCLTKTDGTYHCECPKICPTAFSPICASDGQTYTNECTMRKTSCRRGKAIRIQYDGECEIPDPCRNVKCEYSATCVSTVDGGAKCECPSHCSAGRDIVDDRPVCGSDGVEYEDTCQLLQTSCLTKTNITVRFHGRCNPCLTVTCAEPGTCQLDSDRNPVCRCIENCSLKFTPVCGSDGNTYSSECVLRQESCRSRKNISTIYQGKCSSGPNPCDSVLCDFGQQCAISKSGTAHCECPLPCEPVMSPVCGDDGRTYDSLCEMNRIACTERQVVILNYTGRCGHTGPCTTHTCDHGGMCVEKDGKPMCTCPVCSSALDPVCGSDGVSYTNECKLRQESCKTSSNITVVYNGNCNGCQDIKCEYYAVCDNDETGNGKCSCPDACDKVNAPVCGNDSVTYDNECELRAAACKTQQSIIAAYIGECDPCKDLKCKYGARCEAGSCLCPTDCNTDVTDISEPVCASNMVTYDSECEMEKASCLQPKGSSYLTVIFYGECRENFSTGLTTATFSYLREADQYNMSTTTRPHIKYGMENKLLPLFGMNNDINEEEEEEACRDIRCYFDATCELGPDKFPRCSCTFDCRVATLSGDNKPVCGSDLRLYPSMCAMKMEGCQRQEELRLRPLDLCEGMEVKPCNGESPLINPDTDNDYNCGNGPDRHDCPSGSYCHQTPFFAKCCKKADEKICADSWYGCCPDGRTPALGPDDAGCPSHCGCNKLGSYSNTCDPESEQCACKPGVGGVKCDRCEPGFWGLPKISEGHEGCLPCACSVFGSVRDDCEQMTGRCMCKPGIQGQKCTVCSGHNMVLGPNGCVPANFTTPPPKSCSELTCFFDAKCEEHNGLARCICRSTCSEELDEMQAVCGNDGQSYASECQLKLFVCKYQKDIVVKHLGACKELLAGTEGPVGRFTAHRYTESEYVSSSSHKSTRDVIMSEFGHLYYYTRRHDETNNLTSASLYHSAIGTNSVNVRYRPTPATIQVVSSFLGDMCTVEKDCLVKHSYCLNGFCTCRDGFRETLGRRECFAAMGDACSSSPCEESSSCHNTPDGSFKCVCPPLRTGRLCTISVKPKEYEIPSFDRVSFIRLKRLKAYNKLSLEVEFITYANEGILLYNQQNADGTGDFVSLAIISGHVDFRYNLGNGPVVITSAERVQLKRFHRIVIKRYNRDGILKLDELEDVRGQSQGALKALDLEEDAYIGYVPTNISKVFENIGTSVGLMGCIRKLKIGRHTVELHEGHDVMVEEVDGVQECGENPCSKLPCLNSGTCLAIDPEKFECICTMEFTGESCENKLDPCHLSPCTFGSTCDSLPHGGYVCKCPPGKKGRSCEEFDSDLHEVTIPEFQGDSFIELRRLDGVGRAFSLELWFMSTQPDGCLLYNGQLPNGKGDFISLNLVNGHVQFKFDLGSGTANLTTSEIIRLGQWHSAKITRINTDATLRLDDGQRVYGSSVPPHNELNLELPFYIGGVPSFGEVSSESQIKTGLVGAIQRVIVNGHSLANLAENSEVTARSNIKLHEGLPCPLNDNPCINGGICQPMLNEYGCKCPMEYTGRHCEIHLDLKNSNLPVKFNGTTFLSYSNEMREGVNSSSYSNEVMIHTESREIEDFDENVTYGGNELNSALEVLDEDMYDYEDDAQFFQRQKEFERYSSFELRFKTRQNDGLIIWFNISSVTNDEYIAIAVSSGVIEYTINFGQKMAVITLRSKVYVTDGAWHTLAARRRGWKCMLRVDNEITMRSIAYDTASELNNNGQLWIGGAPTLPAGLPASFYLGFNGCIGNLRVDNYHLNMLERLKSAKYSIHFCYD